MLRTGLLEGVTLTVAADVAPALPEGARLQLDPAVTDSGGDKIMLEGISVERLRWVEGLVT